MMCLCPIKISKEYLIGAVKSWHEFTQCAHEKKREKVKVAVDVFRLELVGQLGCLGVTITEDGRWKQAIKKRMGRAKTAVV